MKISRHLNHAPLVEALIDFRVVMGGEFSPNALLMIEENLRDRFPKSQKSLVLDTWSDGLGEEKEPIPKIIHGISLHSTDGLDVLQARIDGFSVSRLQPYKNWEQLLSVAKEFWPVYCLTMRPLLVTRLAVRFINRIELPSGLEDLRVCLTAPPPLPPGETRPMRDLLTRIAVEDKQGATGAIVQKLSREFPSGKYAIILDIEASANRDYPPDSPAIWETLQVLRELKNEMFFASISETALKRFE